MYGAPVNISIFGNPLKWGAAPDGTFRPEADVECMVSFDPVAAGCGVDGFCNPGADISWYVNGTLVSENPWTGINRSLGNVYVATYRVVAPQSGVMIVTAKSANSVTFTIPVSSIDTQAGQVTISNLTCYGAGATLAQPCTCANAGTAGQVTVWFGATATSVGNGTAYYDVYVNGALSIANRTVDIHTVGERINGSINIPCPPTGSTISIKGKNDSGGSTIVASSTTPVPPYVPPVVTPVITPVTPVITPVVTPVATCQYPCSADYCDDALVHWKCTGGCAVRDGITCPSVDTSTATTDPLKVLTDFYNANKMLSVVGIALLGGFIVFSK
jgi:hypothetical protein